MTVCGILDGSRLSNNDILQSPRWWVDGFMAEFNVMTTLAVASDIRCTSMGLYRVTNFYNW